MQQNYLYILLLIITFFICPNAQAQKQEDTDNKNITQDSVIQKKKFIDRIVNYFEEAKKDKSQSKFDLSFIGGPSYSVDTKLGIGIVASGLYRLDKENMALPPSSVSIYTNFTTSGFFSIGVENNSIFPNDDYRFNYDMHFAYMPSKFYGIGYDAGEASKYTKYDEYQLGLKADILKKVLPNTYVGLTFSAQNYKAKNFEDEYFKPHENPQNTAIGGGFILSYDSRDFIPNPYKGIFLQYEQLFFPRSFGSNRHFERIEITARAYHQIWPKGILAFDLNGIFNSGDVPWNMLSQVGGSRQMRGYFIGQYRDRKQINSQVEIRQKIYNRHGVALWGGAGNIFDDFNNFDWEHTLPTYGIGYRWEFKNRVNVRLDYSFAKGQGGFYFNINESF